MKTEVESRNRRFVDTAVEATTGEAGGPRPTTRRTFIVAYLGLLMGAIVAAVAAPLAVYIYPANGGNKKKPISVTLNQALDSLTDGAALQFNAPPAAAFVMVDGGGVNKAGNLTYGGYFTKVGGRVQAYAITCPHLGCSYALDAGGAKFLCPCHGSQFSLTGQVLHGPATSPLSHLAFRPGDRPDAVLIDGVSQ